MKLGFEVEGRLSGLYTLFMDAKEAMEFFNYKSLKDRSTPKSAVASVERVQQIYVSDHANDIQPYADCLKKWYELGLPVTLERTEIYNRDSYSKNVTIMLTITDTGSLFNDSFWNLYDTDQVKFSRTTFDGSNTVRCITVGNMMLTQPQAFADDITLKVSTDKKFLLPGLQK
jgi:hypothetical protein